MSIMHLRVLGICCLLAPALWAGSGSAAQQHMSVDEVRPGMTGVGRTAFQGTTLDEFTVHILGVLRNNVGPRRDLILARLEGGPLAKAGVIAGMSGSPVYVEGRLIGAVSYALGSFPTEAIAGITPIAEMIEATATGGGTPARIAPIPVDATPAAFLAALSAAIRPPLPFSSAGTEAVALMPGSVDPAVAAKLVPIATPLSIGSTSGPVAARVFDALGPAGFVPVAHAARSDGAQADGPLRPGDPLGVALVTGDLSVAATGTVTAVDGSRVYAFGHAFFNLGTVGLPMTRAYVHTVLPSLMSSIKVASAGDVIGTVVQDRVTGIAGTLGAQPDMVPVRVTLRPGRGAPAREVVLSVADDPLLTPLFTFSALLNTFGSVERELGSATYKVKATIAIRGRGIVEYEDVLTGDSAATAAAATVAVPVGAVMTSDLEKLRVERIALDVTTEERPSVATIQRAWLDSADVRPGRKVPLKVHLRTWRGDDVVQTIPIDIPEGVTGPLTILVADAQRLTQWEQRDVRPPAPATSVDQLLRQLRQIRRNHMLYVRLYVPSGGAIVNGEPMPALPSSVLGVVQGDRSSSGSAPMQSAILGSWDIPLGQAVSGVRTLTVPNQREGRQP